MNRITARLVDTMKKELTRSRYIDVSRGSEKLMLVSRRRLNTALNILIAEGYSVVSIKIEGSDKPPFRLLCRPQDAAITDILKQRRIPTASGSHKEHGL